MKKIDIAYLAGIIDGDGCISIQKNSGVKSYRVIITVVQRDMPLIEYLFETFGGSVNAISVNRKFKKDYYLRWVITDKKAHTLLKLCLPYLKLKKKQAFIAYNLLKLKRFKGAKQDKRGYTKYNIEKQKEFFLAIKSLNSPATTERVGSLTKEMRQSELAEMINRQSAIRSEAPLININ